MIVAIMSLANKITLGRAVLIAPIIACLFWSRGSSGGAEVCRWVAFFLFGFACLGDVLDGMAARSRNEITTWGQILDPLVDKALYVALICSLYVLGEVHLLSLILFVIPPVALGVGAVVLGLGKRTVQSARVLGKAAAFLSFLSMGFLMMEWPGGRELLYAAIAASYVASVD
ncbi:MAG TPA: CDP-alcohol phosphatidyltransferase family protein, partial [Candidatus Acetothermia bacterium]|nr:CDP-alcohol phosphatidyltransferase family protein [Candidatus Acetothermia bacterium]